MASAWGDSWGVAWGDSWSSGVATSPVFGGAVGRKRNTGKPIRIVLSVDDEEVTIDEDEIEDFVEEITERIEAASEQQLDDWVSAGPPVIVIKSAPKIILWDIRRAVDRSNDILKVVWMHSMRNHLNELDDEDAMSWMLQ